MKFLSIFAAVATFAVAAPAIAETSADVEASTQLSDLNRGRLVTSDGRNLGRIDDVSDSSVRIIKGGKFVTIPISTITPTEKKRVFMTSLAYNEVD